MKVTTRTLGLFTAAMMLFAACAGPASTPTQTSSPSAPAATGTIAPSPTLQGETTFLISSSTFGFSQVPLLAAIDALNGQGYNVEMVELAESELAVEGTAQGDFQFSTGTTQAAFLADQKGADLKLVANRVENEWGIYSIVEIADCADLGGRRVAIHSEGAVSTAMQRNYISEECAGTEPEELIISGSPNRLAALLAGQIDATALELSDGIQLLEQEPDKFHILTNFAQTLPRLKPSTIYGNGDFVVENPGSVQALLRALLEEHRKIADDVEYLKTITEEHLPGAIDPDLLDLVAERYVELGLFDVNGGLTEDAVQYSINFFTDAGVVEPGLEVDEVSDLSHLNAVLEEIGRQ